MVQRAELVNFAPPRPHIIIQIIAPLVRMVETDFYLYMEVCQNAHLLFLCHFGRWIICGRILLRHLVYWFGLVLVFGFGVRVWVNCWAIWGLGIRMMFAVGAVKPKKLMLPYHWGAIILNTIVSIFLLLLTDSL